MMRMYEKYGKWMQFFFKQPSNPNLIFLLHFEGVELKDKKYSMQHQYLVESNIQNDELEFGRKIDFHTIGFITLN